MKQLYLDTALQCSRVITNQYSTSFSLGIRTLDKRFHPPINAIYGFVRFADEIVDTFHEQDKAHLLESFQQETFAAIDRGFSANPVLHAFQWVVTTYGIERELIHAFLNSMAMDLNNNIYTQKTYEQYIWGSAEVVGLMCLTVFVEGDKQEYERLMLPATKLGSAFQKVNFLRDLKSDYHERGRIYFPNLQYQNFDENAKRKIEEDIEADFDAAYEGIKKLPKGAKFGVFLAYNYYQKLFCKIKESPCHKVRQSRIRLPNLRKFQIMMAIYLKTKLNLV